MSTITNGEEGLGKIYYVYEYWNPITNTPMYVGKGSFYRYLDHVNKHCRIPDLAEEIIKIYEKGEKPKIIRTWFDTEKEAFDYEVLLIAKYGRRNKGTGTLHNKSKGGPGPGGDFKWNEEQRQKLADVKATEEYRNRRKLGIQRMHADPEYRKNFQAAVDELKKQRRANWSPEKIEHADKANEKYRLKKEKQNAQSN